MIRTYSLHTSEIDDPELAAGEIAAQVKAIELLAHSVGIVICHHDFVMGEALSAIVEVLPFPVIGSTSFYQSAPGATGLFELTITVLTSDDVRFAVAGTGAEPPSLGPEALVQGTYRRAYDVYGEKPAMIFSFMSVHRPISGDEYVRLVDEASGGVPNFGGVTTGDDESGTNVFVLYGDEVSTYGFAMLLVVGDIDARFYMGNFKEEQLMGMTTTVTKAEGVVVYELNDQPATAYLAEHGFTLSDEERSLISNIPFLIKVPGETTMIARTLVDFAEDGSLTFLAEVPVGSVMRIGMASIDKILEVSHEVTQQAVHENPNAQAMFLFSCVGRYITLGLSPTSEMVHVAEVIPADLPYIACYVGGEICPIAHGRSTAPSNRYHNMSFIVCVLA